MWARPSPSGARGSATRARAAAGSTSSGDLHRGLVCRPEVRPGRDVLEVVLVSAERRADAVLLDRLGVEGDGHGAFVSAAQVAGGHVAVLAAIELPLDEERDVRVRVLRPHGSGDRDGPAGV